MKDITRDVEELIGKVEKEIKEHEAFLESEEPVVYQEVAKYAAVELELSNLMVRRKTLIEIRNLINSP